jgi:exosome complex RNA-binding protein Csl4
MEEEYEETVYEDDEEEEEEEEETVEADEVEKVIIDDNHRIIIVVPKHERITSDNIGEAERSEAIGIRASQIENGSVVYTDVTGLTSSIKMAEKEFNDRQSPLILERTIKEKKNKIILEHWKVRKMTYLLGGNKFITSKDINSNN